MSLNIKKLDIGFFPTPLHELKNLEKYFNKGRLFIKRDDLTGFGCGGNKIRKLEYILKKAIDDGFKVICTYGGVQTNHGRLVAALCAKLNLKSVIICSGKRPENMSGNLVLDKLFSADLFFMNEDKIGDLNEEKALVKKNKLQEYTKNKVIEKYKDLGEKVFFVPMGGHNSLGMLGYFYAAIEINNQLKNESLDIKNLVCAVGTGGTYTGLLLGAKYCNASFDVFGISVFNKSSEDINDLVELANLTSSKYKLGVKLTKEDFKISNNYLGNGYNIPDEKTRKYMYLLSSKEGIVVDPCYTGKAFMGFCDYIIKDYFTKDSNSIFLHTGGQAGIFSEDHLKQLENELWDDNYQEFSYTDT